MTTICNFDEYRQSINPDCYQAVCDAFDNDRPTLVEALPAMGKSRGVVLWAAETQNPLTVYTLRHDLYRQYEESCAELGLRYARIPSQRADCPLGEHYEDTHGEDRHPEADDWEDRLNDLQSRLGSSAAVHKHLGSQLPCQSDGPCPFVEALDRFHEELEEIGEGNADRYDVIIGNYLHAFSHSYTEIPKYDGNTVSIRQPGRYHRNRHVALDEFPGDDAIRPFSSERFQKSVSAYLSREPALPFDNYAKLHQHRHSPEYQPKIRQWRANQTQYDEFDTSLSMEVDTVSPEAPLLTEFALSYEALPVNGYGRAEIGENAVAVKSGDDGQVWLLNRPPLTGVAKSTIALDGTPSVELWELLLPDIDHYDTLPTDEQKRAYLRNELGLRIVQTNTNIKPYARGDDFNPNAPSKQVDGSNRQAVRDILAFKWMIDSEDSGEAPSLISTKVAIDAYRRERYLSKFDRVEHYNNLIGTNGFGQSRFGIVAGCNYPGDEVVRMWAALCGEGVQVRKNKDGERIAGRNLSFGEFGDSILRTFRENDVLQAVMRFGREPDDAGHRGATVYVHTAALPEWVTPVVSVPRIKLWADSDGMVQVIRTLRRDPSGWTVADVLATLSASESDSVGERQVCRLLNELVDKLGLVTKERQTGEGAGQGNPNLYKPDRLDDLLEFGPGFVIPPKTAT